MANLFRINTSLCFRRFAQCRTGVLNRSHDCLATGVHVDVFHRDLLLALTAVTIQRVE
jgi:hypothetical protein